MAGYPGLRVDVAPFEDWAPGATDSPFDLVTSAQAWHWFDPEVRLAKAQSLLKLGGWLALFWNRPAEDDSPLKQELDRLHADLAPAPLRHPQTHPGERRAYYWSRANTADEWVALARTHSDHRILPPEQLERLLAAVHAVIDRFGGVYEHRYECVLWLGRREDLLPGE